MDKQLPKVSIVTTVLNNREFIAGAIESVLSQTYPNIEHIVKDGGSTDGTLDILNSYAPKIKLVTGKDTGIYDGMNQGLVAASGDIIATLNADDLYASSESVKSMIEAMEEKKSDVGWGDLFYVDRQDISKIVRRWKSSDYGPGKFHEGWHPPHPTFFVRKQVYEKYGYFRTDMRISADYELMLRFLEKHRASSVYVPEVLVKMRTGGASGSAFARFWEARREDWWAWRVNGIRGGLLPAFFLKPLSKLAQYF